MHQRTFTLASAALGLAASFATSVSAYAADDCLSGPKATTPAGQHWYYRIDRATKKHCWYLADEGTRANKPGAAKTAATKAGTQDAQTTPLQESVADARAELPLANALPSTNTLPSRNTLAAEPPLALPRAAFEPDGSLSNESSRHLTERDLITQAPTTLASRLPLPNEFQPAEPQPDQAAQIAVSTPGDLTKQPNAAQDTQGTGAHIGPMQIFLCALAIALALAAILGRVFFRYVAGGRRKQVAQIRRRQIWPDEMSLNSTQPSYAQMITPERRAREGRVDHDVTEIERLLRGGSRRLR